MNAIINDGILALQIQTISCNGSHEIIIGGYIDIIYIIDLMFGPYYLAEPVFHGIISDPQQNIDLVIMQRTVNFKINEKNRSLIYVSHSCFMIITILQIMQLDLQSFYRVSSTTHFFYPH